MGTSVEYDFHTGVLRLWVKGDLDLRSATELRQKVRKALAEHPLAVILHLGQVSRVHGRSALILPTLARRRDEAPILICAPRNSEPRPFIRRTYPDLAVFETEDEAIADLAAHPPKSRRRVHAHLTGDANAPMHARRMVREACVDWGLEELRPRAEVIVSELVSNAVRHAGSDVEVSFSVGMYYCHIHVRDRSARLPLLPQVARGVQADHRGIKLVETLASGWGTTIAPYGKLVWATIRLPGGQAWRGRLVPVVCHN
jgi:anti-sigma regulatory factor (Ser/Thr protein kinase)